MKIFIYIMVLFTAGYLPLNRYAGPALRRHLGWRPYLSVGAVWLTGMITPWPPLVLAVSAIVPLFRPGTRLDVACRYVLLVPLMPEVSVNLAAGGHSLLALRPLDMLGFGSLVAGAMATGLPPRAPFAGIRPEQLTVIVLALVFGVAAPRFGDVSALIRGCIDYLILLAVPFCVLQRTVRTREELVPVIACFGAAAVLLVLPALYEHHAGWALFDGMTERLNGEGGFARSASIRGGALRASTTMTAPVEFGAFLTLGLFAIYFTQDQYRRKRLARAAMALVFLALLAAQSRGALVAMLAGIMAVVVAQRRLGLATAVLAAGGFGYAMLNLASQGSERVAAFMGAGQNIGNYRDYRTLLLERGLQEGRKHPFVGTSLSSVTDALADLTQGEHIVDFVNSYLNIYLVSGLLGLGALLLALAGVYARLLARMGPALRRAPERPRMFFLAGLTSMLVSLVSISFFGDVPVMLMILLAGTQLVGARASRRLAEENGASQADASRPKLALQTS